jgi:dienelactone hydrolase
MRRRLALSFALLLLVACGDRTTSSPSPAGDGPFAVGTVEATFVDTSRPTAANGDVPAKDSRTLFTRIYYPALGTPGPREVPAATPATSAGPFPLVVFAHGFQAVSEVYRDIYLAWAEAGYVVAAPDFPLSSSRSTSNHPVAFDYVNQPADLGFLIDRLLEESAREDGVLAGLIDPERIGASGQSLGGMTTMGLVYHTCCADRRVDAAIPMAGRLAPFPDGTYTGGIETPLLVVHGDRDDTIPYADGRAIYDAASGPRFILTIVGGDHIVPYVAGPNNPLTEPVLRGVVAFFDFYLKGRPDGLERLFALDALELAEVEGGEPDR